MDLISWIALGVITVINVGGWAYTKVYGYGKLEQKVKNLDCILNDGLVKEVSDMKTCLAKMEGTLNTYIELTKEKFGGER